MAMRVINLRVPDDLHDEAERLAAKAGLSLGLWVRWLIERETSITVDVKFGLAAADKKTRARVQKLGVKASKAKAKEKAT